MKALRIEMYDVDHVIYAVEIIISAEQEDAVLNASQSGRVDFRWGFVNPREGNFKKIDERRKKEDQKLKFDGNAN